MNSEDIKLNKSKIERIISVSVSRALENGYKSYDISDLYRTPFDSFLAKKKIGITIKIFLKLYREFIKSFPEMGRALVKDTNLKYPQAQSMYIRTMVDLYNKGNRLGNLEGAISEAEWLIQNRSPLSKHYGWGQPFLWYTKDGVFKKNVPRATVSSQVGMAMMDLFDLTMNEKYLSISRDICNLFLEEFQHEVDSKGGICISYTTNDNYVIHNSSMLAAAFIMRVYSHTNEQILHDFAVSCAKFTQREQLEDGAFEYWGRKYSINSKIDNYHTGFVLESYKNIEIYGGTSDFNNTYYSGMDYYKNMLFDKCIPRMTKEEKFPIDIQSCAQAIYTFSMDKKNIDHVNFARCIANYTINDLYDDDLGYFIYQINKRTIDKSYYFRWGDSWMLRSLGFLL